MGEALDLGSSARRSIVGHQRGSRLVALGLSLLWLATFAASGLALAALAKVFPNNAPAATNPFDNLENVRLVAWSFRAALLLGLIIAISLVSPQIRNAYGRIPPVTGLIAVLLWLISASIVSHGEMADDTWIYMRVADMVRQTGLPLWNPQDRFTPATSFIWPYVLAIGADPEQRMLVSTIVSVVLIGSVAIYAWFTFNRTWPATVLAAGLALGGTVVYWGSVGMATGLAVAAVAATAIWMITSATRRWTWLLGGCLIFIRPELVLLPLAGAIVWVFLKVRREPDRHAGATGRALAPLVLTLLPVILYFIVNRILFVRPLPTPLYFKGSLSEIGAKRSFLDNFPGGIAEALGALSTNFAIAALTVAAIAAIVRHRRIGSQIGSLAPVWPVLVGALALVALNVSWGYQHMGYGFRYFQPSLAALSVAAFCLAFPRIRDAEQLAGPPRESPSSSRASWSVAVVVMSLVSSTAVFAYFMYLCVGLGPAKTRDWFSAHGYTAWLDEGFLANGRYLAQHAPHDSRVYSYVQIQALGLIPQSTAYEAYYAPIYLSSDRDLQDCSALEATPESGTSYFGYPPLPGIKRGEAGYGPSMDCLRLFDFVVFRQGEGGEPGDLIAFRSAFENVAGAVWKRKVPIHHHQT